MQNIFFEKCFAPLEILGSPLLFILACTILSFFAPQILDTDDLGAKLTNYTLVKSDHLALIDKKLHETNYTGIFFSSFLDLLYAYV